MVLYALDLGNKQAKLKSAKVERILPGYFIESSLYGNRSFFNVLAEKKDTRDFESVNDKGIQYVWGTDLDLTTDVTDASGFGLTRYKSREFQLLTDFALAELAIHDIEGEETISVEVVTGLPTDDYMNTQIRDQVTSVIKGTHLVTVDGKTISIVVENLTILPQSLGTIYDIILDDEGITINKDFETANIGLVDVGGGTVLIDALRSLNMAYDKRVQTTNGSYALFRTIANKLNEKNIIISEYELEKAIRNHNGIWSPDNIQRIDLNPIIEEESNLYTRRLAGQVKSAYKGFGHIQKIIFTGGAANLLNEEELSDALFGITHIVEDSELSNVRGFYKYALSLKQVEKFVKEQEAEPEGTNA